MTASSFRAYVLLGPLLLMAAVAPAQSHRDPFSQSEVDEIRDTSWQPQLRLPLYVKFARARLTAMEQMRSDPKTKDRPRQTHDKLDEFLLIYDELNDNIETYIDRKDDIRKPLKTIIEADVDFKGRLRTLKEAADIPAEEVSQYEFSLTNTLDTVTTSLQDHRKLLVEQEEAAKHRKKSDTKPYGNSSE